MADKAPTDGGGEARKPSKLRWLLGWVLLPGGLIAALFLTGVHLGARNPDRPVARLLLKLFGGKPGVAEAATSGIESDPALHAPREGAEPGEPIRFSASLSRERLQTIADKTMTPIAELECEELCWAIDKAQDMVALYRVDDCAFTRGPAMLPSMLVCQGTLEKVPSAGERADTEPTPTPTPE